MEEPVATDQILEFEKEYEYDNGDAYRRWVFTVDLPEIATDRPGMGARHVLTGDKLQQDEDTARDFRIRRNGRVIASKEWWQIKHLFPAETLPPWSGEVVEVEALPTVASDEPQGFLEQTPLEWRGRKLIGWRVLPGSPTDHVPGTLLCRLDYEEYATPPNGTPRKIYGLDRILAYDARQRDPRQRVAMAPIVSESGKHSVELAVETIPGTPISAGDTVISFGSSDNPQLPDVRGGIVPLSLEHYYQVRKHWDRDRSRTPIVDLTPAHFRVYTSASEIFLDKKKWGLRKEPWRTRVYVAKPLRRSVARQLVASSDEGAIFELLCRVGGRMPREVSNA